MRAIAFEPRWTLRLRLTMLYGALFIVAGAILLAITYGLVAHSVSDQSKRTVVFSGVSAAAPVTKGGAAQTPKTLPSGQRSMIYFSEHGKAPMPPPPGSRRFQVFASKIEAQARAKLDQQRSAQLNALLTRSGLALGIMAIVSIGLGWLMAGRALRPMRTMATRARGITERNLHERLAVDGPTDELKELGDTFDGLLGRLESAFESQRRFVANASHELRTPITVERTLVEVALADPHATAGSLRATCERVLAAGEQQERLIESLLTLARSQRGLESRRSVDLAAVTREVVRGATARDVAISADLHAAGVSGDPALVERLVANLVENAIHHNQPGGFVRVRTSANGSGAVLRVSNAGQVVPAAEAAQLVEPFRRRNGARTRHANGVGLGLSIVQAIAVAHDASLRVQPRAEGGLEVEVAFPPV
ncbi:MAG: sensor histidine kinase [Solirubrobacteraceae bacterium]